MNIQKSHDDDAMNVAPALHTVLYEDDAMRVLKVSVPVGAHADMHWHPRNINYVLNGGTLKFTKRDGSSVSVDLTKGEVTSATTDVYHAVDNNGDSIVETIQVELK
jgi:quercetin dioxygenase-like cupin family protein